MATVTTTPTINSSKNLKINALTFDQIKENIKAHFKQQNEFKDYDFEGSAMSVMLDTLAYTTHYINVYNNLSLSEIFLDSAQLRNSVVSKAKELNYMPRQRQASIATLSISINDGKDLGASVVVPKNTKFSSEIDGKTYEFVTTDDVHLVKDATTPFLYASQNVPVYQGTFRKQEWTVQTGSQQRFIIENDGVDTRFFTVDIAAQAGSSDIERWTLNEDITQATSASRIYFLQEASNGRVEIYFGDGVVGRVPVNDNLITGEYLVTKGGDSNGCSKFELVNDIGLISRSKFTVTTVQKAREGSERESIDSIKLLAPKSFQAQNRAVTVADYEQLIRKKQGSIETMNIWGGEENVPPEYGKVFICIKPKDAEEVSPATKKRIQDDVLKKYNLVGVTPVIVNPDYTYIDVNTVITVDMRNSSRDRGQLVTTTEETIKNYFKDDLNTFGTSFRYSRISRKIDDTDSAIISNRSTVTFSKKFIPDTTQEKTYLVYFNGGVTPKTLITNKFGFETDDTKGRLRIRDDGVVDSNGYGKLVYTKVQVYKDTDGKLKEAETIIKSDIGQIHYATGVITFRSFQFVAPANTTITMTATPSQNDIDSLRNNLLVAGDNIKVTLEELQLRKE